MKANWYRRSNGSHVDVSSLGVIAEQRLAELETELAAVVEEVRDNGRRGYRLRLARAQLQREVEYWRKAAEAGRLLDERLMQGKKEK